MSVTELAPPAPDAALLIAEMARAGRVAQRGLALLDDATKARGLESAAQALRDGAAAILAANARDMAAGTGGGAERCAARPLTARFRRGWRRWPMRWRKSRGCPIRWGT